MFARTTSHIAMVLNLISECFDFDFLFVTFLTATSQNWSQIDVSNVRIGSKYIEFLKSNIMVWFSDVSLIFYIMAEPSVIISTAATLGHHWSSKHDRNLSIWRTNPLYNFLNQRHCLIVLRREISKLIVGSRKDFQPQYNLRRTTENPV